MAEALIELLQPIESVSRFLPLSDSAKGVIAYGFSLKQSMAFLPIGDINIFYGALCEGSSNQHLVEREQNVSSLLLQIERYRGVTILPAKEVVQPPIITTASITAYMTQSGLDTLDFAQRVAKLAKLDEIDSSSLLVGSVFAARGDFRALLRRNGLTPPVLVYGREVAGINTPQG